MSLDRAGTWSCREASGCCPFDPVADFFIIVDDPPRGHSAQGHIAQKRYTEDFTLNVPFTEDIKEEVK